MARFETLDNISHQDVKIKPYFSEDLGDNVASTITFITEFAEVQKEYPILIRKEAESGLYQAVALFGIQKNENLFLSKPDPKRQKNPGWNGNYIPAAIARGPFSIGVPRPSGDTGQEKGAMVNIDMESPKVSKEEGLPLFLEHGGNSAYLEQISSTLNLIRDGMHLNKPMFDAYVKYSLLDDVTINIDLDNGDRHKISGFYTINTEALSALKGEALEDLNKSGFLQAAYFILASLSNVRKLINIKNSQLRES
ncbi:SapC family protein [Marinimicrobium locisalis]|uniref:SapC family protein n=1 Tax=Marinimicrobium locisalis TaxID=546022 RepID=UPI003221A111